MTPSFIYVQAGILCKVCLRGKIFSALRKTGRFSLFDKGWFEIFPHFPFTKSRDDADKCVLLFTFSYSVSLLIPSTVPSFRSCNSHCADEEPENQMS